MTTTLPDFCDGQVTRRGIFLGAAVSSLVCAPAIVRAMSLMPLRGAVLSVEQRPPQHPLVPAPFESFARQLFFKWCDSDLTAARTKSSFIYNGERLSGSKMRNVVAYARRRGFLQ